MQRNNQYKDIQSQKRTEGQITDLVNDKLRRLKVDQGSEKNTWRMGTWNEKKRKYRRKNSKTHD